MFGLLEKVGKTIWEVSNLPVDIARDIVTQDDDSLTEDDLDKIDKNLEKIFTGNWNDDD